MLTSVEVVEGEDEEFENVKKEIDSSIQNALEEDKSAFEEEKETEKSENNFLS